MRRKGSGIQIGRLRSEGIVTANPLRGAEGMTTSSKKNTRELFAHQFGSMFISARWSLDGMSVGDEDLCLAASSELTDGALTEEVTDPFGGATTRAGLALDP